MRRHYSIFFIFKGFESLDLLKKSCEDFFVVNKFDPESRSLNIFANHYRMAIHAHLNSPWIPPVYNFEIKIFLTAQLQIMVNYIRKVSLL